jgi:predicted histidine transporter YuiF (NhaC family)
MTAFMCSLFYAYTIYAINYYRKEIRYRLENNDSIIKFKYKAPFSIKKAVLLCLAAIVSNYLLQFFIGSDNLILLNAIPVLCFMFILRRYEKRLIKMDKSE